MTAAIEHHHNPEKAGQFGEITSLVYVSDLLAVTFQKRDEKQLSKGIDVESDPILKKYSITHKMIDDFQNRARSQSRKGSGRRWASYGTDRYAHHLIDSFGE